MNGSSSNRNHSTDAASVSVSADSNDHGAGSGSGSGSDEESQQDKDNDQDQQLLLSRSRVASAATAPERRMSAASYARHRAYKGLGMASLAASLINATSGMLGLAILSIPVIFAASGYLLGSVALLTFAALSLFSVYLLLECARRTGAVPVNWFIVTKAAYPNPVALFCVDTMRALLTLGMMTTFIVSAGDLAPDILNSIGWHPSWMTRGVLQVFLFLAVSFPLSFLRTLSSLRFTSMLAMLALGVLLVIVFLYSSVPSLDACAGSTLGAACRGRTQVATFSRITVQVWPILIYAFTCQQNVFSIFNESCTQSHSAVFNVFAKASGVTAVFKLLIGLLVYSIYGLSVRGNFLLNFPQSSSLLTVCRVCVLLMYLFSYPVQMHPCRVAISSLVHQLEDDYSADNTAYVASDLQMTLYTVIIGAVALTLGLVVKDLGSLIAVLGATIGAALALLLPALLYLRLHPATAHESSFERLTRRAALGLAIGCAIIIPTCLTLIATHSSDSYSLSQP